MNENQSLSVIVAAYNEENILSTFLEDLIVSIKEIPSEIIIVNDGSQDKTLKIALEFSKKNQNIKVINFSRNYGHEAAMIAGIDNSSGDAIICMDSDMQHPCSLIPEIYQKFCEGYEIINMVRKERLDGGWIKYITSKVFYFMLNKITPINFAPNASDFFLISGRCGKILKNEFRERTRFLRGFVQTLGFKKTTLEFTAPKRGGGKSKYSLGKLFLFSITAIVSFSKMPLRISIILGFLMSLSSFFLGIYSIIMKFLEKPFSGYTTIIVMISFLFGVLFIVLGIIGEYLGYLFDEIKKRPLYIIESKFNFENQNE